MPVVSSTLSILEKQRSLRYYLLLPDAHGLLRDTKLIHNENTKGKSQTADQWRYQEFKRGGGPMIWGDGLRKGEI